MPQVITVLEVVDLIVQKLITVISFMLLLYLAMMCVSLHWCRLEWRVCCVFAATHHAAAIPQGP